MTRKYKTTYLDIDLSFLLKREPKLIPDKLVELKMLEFYKYYQNEYDSIYFHFTKWLLKILFMSDSDYDVSEINNFYSTDLYENVVIEFNNEIDFILMLNLDNYNFVNIEFDSYVTKTEDKLIVRFKVITLERGIVT